MMTHQEVIAPFRRRPECISRGAVRVSQLQLSLCLCRVSRGVRAALCQSPYCSHRVLAICELQMAETSSARKPPCQMCFYVTVSQAHEITVKIMANLKHVFFNKCSLPAFYEALFYCCHKNFNSLYLEVFELHFSSSLTLQSVSLICNLYRFSAQQQQRKTFNRKRCRTRKSTKDVTETEGQIRCWKRF